ncbi:hypothetical protein CUMW_205930 [Citrus unshiu]|uniref:Uncharacterized protein n=1 Tax=Citrus unshiu TaxID=55188 RepID=A0A2H5Q8G6_CITUN|nr:hypothetical protein CUMW_205930 [Citrus unshiu]
MTGEEMTASPAGTKILRLLYFFGVGFVYRTAVDKWRELIRSHCRRNSKRAIHGLMITRQLQ